jgi:hypothetical protein
MNKETFKTLLAVLRVFVSAVNRGHDSTLHAHEVTNEVCRIFQRRKDSEKKNTHGFVVAALRALKAKQILFEAIDDWSDDRLNRPKAAEHKRTFGLTIPALDYLTSERNSTDYSGKSDALLTNMLAYFDVIPRQQNPNTVVPAVLVETVRRIEQKEKVMTEKHTLADTTPADNNVQRLVATVNNTSDKWLTNSTPRDLLGGLLALEQSGETNENVPASTAKLLWPDSKRTNYVAAREFLRQHNLIDSFKECKNPHDSNSTRPYGIKLTALGREVAVAGEFKDERPAAERWHTKAKNGGKNATMIKGNKKRMSADATNNTPVHAPSGPISDVDFKTMMTQFQTIMTSLSQRVEAAEKALETADKTGVALPAVQHTAAAKLVEYDEQETMRRVLRDAVKLLTSAFWALIDDPKEMKNNEEPATAVNAAGLYLALTEIEKAVHGIKAYVSECMDNETDVDLEMIAKYADDYSRAAEELPTKLTLPIMATELLLRRRLTGDKAVHRTKWNRGVKNKI